MKKILLILTTLATLSQADFIRYDTGIVKDTKTNLEWQDDYSDNNNTVFNYNWTYAVAYCHDLELDGTGWRLPNINELKSIIVDTTAPTIDSVFEHTPTSGYYWSSTTHASYGSHAAWVVSFSTGSTDGYGKSDSHYYVRCVR